MLPLSLSSPLQTRPSRSTQEDPQVRDIVIGNKTQYVRHVYVAVDTPTLRYRL